MVKNFNWKNLFYTSSPEKTMELGKKIGEGLQAGDVVALIGELGAGKTLFTQGLVQGLGVKGYVKSPSFTIVNRYEGRLPVYHLDLYRLGDVNEIYELGIEEYLYGDGVTIIEWAEKAYSLLPEKYILIKFFYRGEKTRKIEIKRLDE
ncbi:MAG: tRNA (adenosine(37)-N6)-threonylcarbamoyltransferase complex ATPase subunit type 1 TsaE [Deltaproteobacteria bacterium]|nr:tRNA (adenosine(37)-N6)-threonylcarbamoyltransferase complex ATPase subunit type 1 TsaE [Nitrospirota bacterium]MBI3753780.1 tRNA (adenosine(37)-N6)-threonylcarbamoyltransferase complex ATPase subunit type 1 TsaE [Deltaproteobacteria bacterium]